MDLPLLPISALTAIVATASTLNVSAARQEHLSSRLRQITKEFRAIVSNDKEKIPAVKRNRLRNLAAQALAFEHRLSLSVAGHLWLYKALTAEVIGFMVVCGWMLWQALIPVPHPIPPPAIDPKDSAANCTALIQWVLAGGLQNPQGKTDKYSEVIALAVIALAFVALARGLWMHICEYSSSDRTMQLEMLDIRNWAAELRVSEMEVRDFLKGSIFGWEDKAISKTKIHIMREYLYREKPDREVDELLEIVEDSRNPEPPRDDPPPKV